MTCISSNRFCNWEEKELIRSQVRMLFQMRNIKKKSLQCMINPSTIRHFETDTSTAFFSNSLTPFNFWLFWLKLFPSTIKISEDFVKFNGKFCYDHSALLWFSTFSSLPHTLITTLWSSSIHHKDLPINRIIKYRILHTAEWSITNYKLVKCSSLSSCGLSNLSLHYLVICIL